MFVLSFKNGDNDVIVNLCFDYYVPLVEIKDFNGLIESETLFDQCIKSKQEAYEKLAEKLRNDN